MFLCFTVVRDQKATWPSRAPNAIRPLTFLFSQPRPKLREIAVVRDWMRYHHGHQRAGLRPFREERN